METLHHRISRAVQEKRWTPIRATRGGTPFSHLFFADDLLLFGQAFYLQAKVMDHIMDSFCQAFGQLMNRTKSILWFSPNTPGYLKHSISTGLGITCTASLGTYLGVPLIHGRVTKSTYQYLVDRVRRKLTAWKINFLSRAARVTLIQTTLRAIPIHAMQSTLIPMTTVEAIEKVCRAFFWGERGMVRKMHTLHWDKICQP